MPRTTKEIIDQADELARRFEAGELPDGAVTLDARPLRDIREAFEDVAHAQKRLADRVGVAKASGHSWAMIGMMLGTSGEAARQRYGTSASAGPAKKVAAAKAPRAVKVVGGKVPGPKPVWSRPAAGGTSKGTRSTGRKA